MQSTSENNADCSQPPSTPSAHHGSCVGTGSACDKRKETPSRDSKLLQTPPSFSPCPVCLSPLAVAEAAGDCGARRLFKTFCGHTFHLQCIGGWVAARPLADCPSCRASLHAQAYSPLRDFCQAGGLRGHDAALTRGNHQGQVIAQRAAQARAAVLASMQQTLARARTSAVVSAL